MLRYLILCNSFLFAAYEITDYSMYTFNVGQGNCQVAKYYTRDVINPHTVVGFLVDCGMKEFKHGPRFDYAPGSYVKIIKGDDSHSFSPIEFSKKNGELIHSTVENKANKHFDHVAECL